jgi:ribosomal protein L11 methylase PrmA
MSHNGKLVLAGLLLDQEQDVMTVAINARLTLIDRYEEDDWVALVFQNSDLIPET